MKNLNTLFLPACLLVLMIGCSPKSHVQFGKVTFTKLDSSEISLPYAYNIYASFSTQEYERHDTAFLMISDIDNHSLIEIDLDRDTVSRIIPIKYLMRDQYPTFLFEYKNEDTILILREISNTHRTHDSVLFSINIRGELTTYYDLNTGPFYMAGQKEDSTVMAYYSQLRPWDFYKNRLFFHPTSVFGTRKNEAFLHRHHLPLLAYLDFGNSDSPVYDTIHFHTPFDDSGIFAYDQNTISLTPLSKNNLVVSFAKSLEFYKVNVRTGDFSRSRSDKALIPVPVAVQNQPGNNVPSFNQQSSVFSSLLYDPTTQHILRFASFPTQTSLKFGDLMDFRSQHQWVGVYDTTLQLIAQGLKPSWLTSTNPRPTFSNGRLISLKQNGNDKHTIKIIYSEVHIQEGTNEDYQKMKTTIDSIKAKESGTLGDYIDKYHLPANSRILLIPSGSCPKCVNYVMSYYLQNRKQLVKDEIYLITDNQQIFNLIDSLDSKYIILDKKREIENYLDMSINNPTIMLWDGRKISKTIVLQPDKVVDIAHYLEYIK